MESRRRIRNRTENLERAIKIAGDYGNRMRAERDRAVDTAVALENRIAELQEDNRRLRAENETMRETADLYRGKLYEVRGVLQALTDVALRMETMTEVAETDDGVYSGADHGDA